MGIFDFLFGNDDDKLQRQIVAQQQELRRREAKRQANIQEGRSRIDDAFAQFDDNFFSGFQNSFLDFQLPDLDRQFQNATARLTAALAGRGVLDSTSGANQLAELTRINKDTRADIANQGVDLANTLRSQVDSARGDLEQLNLSAADPELAGSRAFASASSLAVPPSFNPLGDVFAAALQPVTLAAAANNNRAGERFKSPFQSAVNRRSSGRVVR